MLNIFTGWCEHTVYSGYPCEGFQTDSRSINSVRITVFRPGPGMIVINVLVLVCMTDSASAVIMTPISLSSSVTSISLSSSRV